MSVLHLSRSSTLHCSYYVVQAGMPDVYQLVATNLLYTFTSCPGRKPSERSDLNSEQSDRLSQILYCFYLSSHLVVVVDGDNLTKPQRTRYVAQHERGHLGG